MKLRLLRLWNRLHGRVWFAIIPDNEAPRNFLDRARL